MPSATSFQLERPGFASEPLSVPLDRPKAAAFGIRYRFDRSLRSRKKQMYRFAPKTYFQIADDWVLPKPVPLRFATLKQKKQK